MSLAWRPHRSGALALTALLIASRADAAPLTVWVVPFLGRVMPGDAPGSARSAVLSAARGEYEPFQVAVRAPAGGLTHVRVEVSDLAGAAGRIASTNLTLFLERYVDVPRSTYCPFPGGNCPAPPGRYPDGLVPFVTETGANRTAVPFAVAPGENQPIWVDLLVPRTAAAGVYVGALTLIADQGRATVPIRLKVWAFELPPRPALRSSFGLLGAQNDLAHQALLLRHRIMPWQIRAANAPRLREQGLNVGGLPLVSNQTRCALDPPPAIPRLRERLAAYPPDLELYVYVADEPLSKCGDARALVPQLRRWARSVHEAGARTLVTTPPAAALLDDGAGRSAVDIWVLLAKQWNPSDPAFQAARAQGNALWAYTALVQDAHSPKWAIDFDPINYRVLPGFLAQSLDLQGVLYWRVDRYGPDPWSDVTYVCCGGRRFAGEGLLVYPGAPVGVSGPVPSMRLKWIREGVDDYDYVHLLRAAGRGDLALQIARTVAGSWTTWSRDPSVLEQARLRLGEELSRLGEARGDAPGGSPPHAHRGGDDRRARARRR